MMTAVSFEYEDSLALLNKSAPLREKLRYVHASVQQKYDFITRIAVAIYDPVSGQLRTYVDSMDEENPLSNYQAELKNVPSLLEILKKGRPRVVNDLEVFREGGQAHTQRIAKQGYSASYTLPMYHNDIFFGFVFFNSDTPNVFLDSTLAQIDLFGHVISLLVIHDLSIVRTMTAAVKTTSEIVHQRDAETGGHLQRMSRYARLIASVLADKHQLNDEYIENIYMFSPMHDIGKVGIPDKILLKPDTLTKEEFDIMKTHTIRGRELIDNIIENFGLDGINNVDVLRNIAEYHHEAVNGGGYPSGIKGDEIPLEARIVAVADVFDALTSRRPYKQAWSNDQAFATLAKMAGNQLDHDCVEALLTRREDVEEIQSRYREDAYG